jgi:hypothetical protein
MVGPATIPALALRARIHRERSELLGPMASRIIRSRRLRRHLSSRERTTSSRRYTK